MINWKYAEDELPTGKEYYIYCFVIREDEMTIEGAFWCPRLKSFDNHRKQLKKDEVIAWIYHKELIDTYINSR